MSGSRPGYDPCGGMKKDRSLRIVATGHAFIQNLRCGHYELATDATARDRVAVAFTELALGTNATVLGPTVLPNYATDPSTPGAPAHTAPAQAS